MEKNRQKERKKRTKDEKVKDWYTVNHRAIEKSNVDSQKRTKKENLKGKQQQQQQQSIGEIRVTRCLSDVIGGGRVLHVRRTTLAKINSVNAFQNPCQCLMHFLENVCENIYVCMCMHVRGRE